MFSYFGGNKTVSMTWMTPFVTGTLAMVTLASFIITPPEKEMKETNRNFKQLLRTEKNFSLQ